MKSQELSIDSLVAFVCDRRHVSYVELERHFNDPGGQFVIELCPNVITWKGVSKELGDCITKAVRNNRISVKPTCLLTYMIDGISLGLPIAKRLPKEGYKRLHWFPVVFDSVSGLRAVGDHHG